MKTSRNIVDYDLARSKRIRRKLPKTGTTIAGLTFRDGVIIATLVVQRRYFACTITSMQLELAPPIIYVDAVARLLRAQLNHLRMTMCTEVPVVCAKHIIKRLFYRFKHVKRMNWIIAGVDRGRASIYSIRFSGASNPAPYVSLGLGEPGATATLESRWEETLDEKEATRLTIDAVRAAIQTDRGTQRQDG
ncbi:proteasome subunit beta type-2-like [Drosophila miranda]|uniref:proteasome subunit beta type-2-like n=1 Tax=Drosophila miranda TaxID=7229 RepID=UPI00143F90E3|nr:proteasome subunit beta type-2-like [Drosophila miranda]